MREDGGDAGADRVADDEGRLPHSHAPDIGDCVVGTGLEHAGRDARRTGTLLLCSGGSGGRPKR